MIFGWNTSLAVLAFAGVSVLAYGMISYFLFRSEARVALRTIMQFIFTIGLPVFLLLGLPVLVLAQFVTLEERIWQALIAAMVILTGWLTTSIFNEISRQRDRSERLRDAHRAIFAEIATYLANLKDAEALDQYGNDLIAKMKADQSFVPLIPKEHRPRIFDAMNDDMYILPRVTIDWIVTYYSQLDAIGALAEDMRGESYKALSSERRIDMYRTYIDMKKVALEFGRITNYIIEVYARDGKKAAEKVAVDYSIRSGNVQISSPAVDRSAP